MTPTELRALLAAVNTTACDCTGCRDMEECNVVNALFAVRDRVPLLLDAAEAAEKHVGAGPQTYRETHAALIAALAKLKEAR